MANVSLAVRVLGESLATRAAARLLESFDVRLSRDREPLILGDAPVVKRELASLPTDLRPAVQILLAPDLSGDGAQIPPHLWEREASRMAGLYEPLLPFASREQFFFPVSSYLAGSFACSALFLALIRFRRTGEPQQVCVSLTDAGLVAQGLQATFVTGASERWSPIQWLASPFKEIWHGADGRSFYLHVGLPRHLDLFLETLMTAGHGQEVRLLRERLHADTLADPISVRSRGEASLVTRVLVDLFAQREALAWENLFAGAGLCCVVVRSFREWCAHPQATLHWDSQEGCPLPPVRLQSRPTGECSAGVSPPALNGLGDISQVDPPLHGLRVLDFTQVIAGPMVGRLMAEMGAHVIRVENPTSNQAFVEPFAAEYHVGKENRVFDLRRSEEHAALWKLVEQWRPHVVLQNFGRGVSDRMRISEGDFRRFVPGVVFMDLNAFGSEGPLADLPGFEQTAQALCGFCRDHARNQIDRLFPLPINDIGAGVLGAAGVLAALVRHLESGDGYRVHTSLAAAATWMQWLGHQGGYSHVEKRAGELLHPVHQPAQIMGGKAPAGPTLKSIVRARSRARHPFLEMVSTRQMGPMPVVRAPILFSGLRLPALASAGEVSARHLTRRPSLRWLWDQFLWGVWLVWRARFVRRHVA